MAQHALLLALTPPSPRRVTLRCASPSARATRSVLPCWPCSSRSCPSCSASHIMAAWRERRAVLTAPQLAAPAVFEQGFVRVGGCSEESLSLPRVFQEPSGSPCHAAPCGAASSSCQGRACCAFRPPSGKASLVLTHFTSRRWADAEERRDSAPAWPKCHSAQHPIAPPTAAEADLGRRESSP